MRKLSAGIDIGSTTTKITITDEQTEKILYSDYKRHHASQLLSVIKAVDEAAANFPDEYVKLAFTGSGAKAVAEGLKAPFIQEVVANSIALQRLYKNVGTAIELGGQDAKMIFFRKDSNGSLSVADMRMNGSCAGGTGAFIDEMASVLKIDVEDFNDTAKKGTTVYDISGRCGVYAKTDIQPLLNRGVPKPDLALSAFHAVAKQTIGGLAQGLDIKPPVAFEGGPLTFNPVLIDVFAQRLNLSSEDILIPPHAETMVSYGAALSLKTMFKDDKGEYLTFGQWHKKLSQVHITHEEGKSAKPFFETEEEKEEFYKRHKKAELSAPIVCPNETIRVYLGIDSGSTTTKFVLIDEEENIIDSFYASNSGDPLFVAKNALIEMRNRWKEKGVNIDVIAAGTTGYGEQLFARAFGADYHVVETVAHCRAAEKYIKNASFILDIGGQDMKAIWLDNGIITNIVVNEACSSGCGSFLENFASSLNIPAPKIAEAAFNSKNPAVLGSRCTVFMNSSIVTEQRNGKQPDDIMAGLCRSIIENVFTKVIRISNTASLGNNIVVQGGTFQNDAVLRAMEQYLGKNVIRAPYPGIMGAIGAALLTKENIQEGRQSSFIGLDNMESFSYKQEANVPCPFCMNHCQRSVMRFSNGSAWVTNNRCERGEILDTENIKEALAKAPKKAPDCFKLREELLFKNYKIPENVQKRNIKIGLPRVLFFWDTMPFWNTFFRSLGFDVCISSPSSHKLFEKGLYAVTSDTVCFPAKLVHGHIRDLAEKKVDRIFMPSISTLKSENSEKTSEWMCAVVKGYPLVIKNSDNPEKNFGIPFDSPLFFWFEDEDRKKQIVSFMKETYGIEKNEVLKAIEYGDKAEKLFHNTLLEEGDKIIADVNKNHKYAVILASRPYQNDSLVNHHLPEMFTSMGIPVLTVDSIRGTEKEDLSKSRIDIVNNFHARMLSTALIAAKNPNLEYVQIVSFGCGHDAYLSDEIIRIMKETAEKTPLVLKLDESEIQGPLRIRVRSFTETVEMKRRKNSLHSFKPLTDPYKRKFTKEDKEERIVLIPNTSHAFSHIMSAAMKTQGLKAVSMDIGREEAIRLGKKYVHNDICFPAQIVIGEALAELESGKYKGKKVAIATGKYIGDCRLTHYGALLRKALDDAGYADIPIVTNDDEDYHNLHPGFKLNLMASMNIAYAMPMIDILEELLRKIRPYELEKGSSDKAFDKAVTCLTEGIEKGGVPGLAKGFKKAIEIMKNIKYDRSNPRPTVLIVGEYLLNFHPGANHDIELFLEKNGFEIIEARMSDVIQKSYFALDMQIREYKLKRPLKKKLWYRLADGLFDGAHNLADKIAKAHPLYDTPACRLPDLVKASDPIIHHTFDAGEGVLIPGEILHHAARGCKHFVILQPFGCLPNHVVGRGITKKLKELYPDVQILPLDYDPDVSFANIENRLQMLIMDIKNK